MTMRLLKPFLAVLLAWTFSFQAMAGVVGMSCRHPPGAMSAPAAQAMPSDHAAMHHDHAAMMQQQAEHAGHMMAAADGETKTIKVPGCECGCDCAKVGCSGACPGVAAIFSPSTLDIPVGSQHAAPASVAPSGAHILALIRPPSMS
ncbi:hypothetical protein C3942_17165 [Solimonas fluminis]|jgi:hypothetical protein|uniref:CopL family metal-binding regulatory protein n=2 Tax=Solimonas fluminis TaxID=2086571 RepID=A0A2S5TCP2_9GAMM|nr:hypothetical protein C3942_17165 [Solimonas fluminis]